MPVDQLPKARTAPFLHENVLQTAGCLPVPDGVSRIRWIGSYWHGVNTWNPSSTSVDTTPWPMRASHFCQKISLFIKQMRKSICWKEPTR